MADEWIVGLAGASSDEDETWYVRTEECSPVQVMTVGTDVCWCANEEMANRIAKLPVHETQNTALAARVAELESALWECRNAMYADNPADGWLEIIQSADAALAQGENDG